MHGPVDATDRVLAVSKLEVGQIRTDSSTHAPAALSCRLLSSGCLQLWESHVEACLGENLSHMEQPHGVAHAAPAAMPMHRGMSTGLCLSLPASGEPSLSFLPGKHPDAAAGATQQQQQQQQQPKRRRVETPHGMSVPGAEVPQASSGGGANDNHGSSTSYILLQAHRHCASRSHHTRPAAPTLAAGAAADGSHAAEHAMSHLYIPQAPTCSPAWLPYTPAAGGTAGGSGGPASAAAAASCPAAPPLPHNGPAASTHVAGHATFQAPACLPYSAAAAGTAGDGGGGGAASAAAASRPAAPTLPAFPPTALGSAPLLSIPVPRQYLWSHFLPGVTCSVCMECVSDLSSGSGARNSTAHDTVPPSAGAKNPEHANIPGFDDPDAAGSDAARSGPGRSEGARSDAGGSELLTSKGENSSPARLLARQAWQQLPPFQQLAMMSGCPHSLVSTALFGALIDSPCATSAATDGSYPFGCFLVGTAAGQVWAYPLDHAAAVEATHLPGVCAVEGGEGAAAAGPRAAHAAAAAAAGSARQVPDNNLDGSSSFLGSGNGQLLFELDEDLVSLLLLPLGAGSCNPAAAAAASSSSSGSGRVPAGALLLVGGKGRVVALTASTDYANLSGPAFQVLSSFLKVIQRPGSGSSRPAAARKLQVQEWQLPFNVRFAQLGPKGMLALLSSEGQVYLAATVTAAAAAPAAAAVATAAVPAGQARLPGSHLAAPGASAAVTGQLVKQLRPVRILCPGPVKALDWGTAAGAAFRAETTSGCVLTTAGQQQQSNQGVGPAAAGVGLPLDQALEQLLGSFQSGTAASGTAASSLAMPMLGGELGMQLRSREACERAVHSAVEQLSGLQRRAAALRAVLGSQAGRLEASCQDVAAIRSSGLLPGSSSSRLQGTTECPGAVRCRLRCQMLLPGSCAVASSQLPLLQVQVRLRLPARGMGPGWKLVLRYVPNDGSLPCCSSTVPLNSLSVLHPSAQLDLCDHHHMSTSRAAGNSMQDPGAWQEGCLLLQLPGAASAWLPTAALAACPQNFPQNRSIPASATTALGLGPGSSCSSGWLQALLCRPLLTGAPRQQGGSALVLLTEQHLCSAQLLHLPQPLGMPAASLSQRLRDGPPQDASAAQKSTLSNNATLSVAAAGVLRKSDLAVQQQGVAGPHHLSHTLTLTWCYREAAGLVGAGHDSAVPVLERVQSYLWDALGMAAGCIDHVLPAASRAGFGAVAGSTGEQWRAVQLWQGGAIVVWKLLPKQPKQCGAAGGKAAAAAAAVDVGMDEALVEVTLSAASRNLLLSLHQALLAAAVKQQRQHWQQQQQEKQQEEGQQQQHAQRAMQQLSAEALPGKHSGRSKLCGAAAAAAAAAGATGTPSAGAAAAAAAAAAQIVDEVPALQPIASTGTLYKVSELQPAYSRLRDLLQQLRGMQDAMRAANQLRAAIDGDAPGGHASAGAGQQQAWADPMHVEPDLARSGHVRSDPDGSEHHVKLAELQAQQHALRDSLQAAYAEFLSVQSSFMAQIMG